MGRRKKQGGSPGGGRSSIAYQNKDITAKTLADSFKGRTLEAFGLALPRVIDAGPTNMPAIEANELKLDNLFYFEDMSVGIIDYESTYSKENMIKYAGYVARIMKRLYNEAGEFRKIRIIVIYTCDVKRGTTNPKLELGGASFSLTEAFLSDLKDARIMERIAGKLDRGEALSDLDLMQWIIYPLSVEGEERKRSAVGKAINLTERLKDQSELFFVLAGIRVFAANVISKADADRIERRMGMVQVIEPIIEKAERRARKQSQKEIAEKLLKAGDDPGKVVECTGLSQKEVAGLQKRILEKVS